MELPKVLADAWQTIEDTGILPLVKFVLVIVVGVVVGKAITKVFHRAMVRRFRAEVLEPVERIVYWVIFLTFFLVGLSAFDVDLTGVLLIGGLLGIAIGFAAQSTISNLLSGIFLQFDRPFKTGDFIEVDGYNGIVEEITVFSTRIRTWDGVKVRIPNDKVFTASIKNYWGCVARRVEIVVGIEYRDDQDRAIQLIKDMLNEHPMVLVEPAAQVFVKNLNESSVDLSVRAWVPAKEWFTLWSELFNLCKHTVEENGMAIAFPQNVLWQGEPEGHRQNVQMREAPGPSR